jgi:uncharacterized short protein YbdD (DUF466 family)
MADADVSARERLRRITRVIRRVIGAPDYERYVEHCRSRHPGVLPLAQEDFIRERLAARYEQAGSRCC